MYDSSMAVQEIYTLLLQDTTISNEIKNKLSTGYPCKTDREKADFIAALLLFGMEREFRKRDANTKNLLAAGSLSPALKDFVFGVKLRLHAAFSADGIWSWMLCMKCYALKEKCSFRALPVLAKVNWRKPMPNDTAENTPTLSISPTPAT